MIDDPPNRRPQSVLFSCTMNAVRSPMAEAIARNLYGREIYFASAGVRAGEPDGFAMATMEDYGVSIAKHKPHTFEDLEEALLEELLLSTYQEELAVLAAANQLTAAGGAEPTTDSSRMQL